MANQVQKAFENIKADDSLKENTIEFLKGKMKESRPAPACKKLFWRGLAAACLFLALGGFGGWQWYFSENAYLSIDVNPSVELGINRLDRVISVESYNEGGDAIKKYVGPKLEHKKYTQAVEILLSDENFSPYVGNGNAVEFTVAARDGGSREDEILTNVESCSSHAGVTSHCGSTGWNDIGEAHGNGFSFGKYRVYLEAKACGSEVDMEDCHHMTISEIQAAAGGCGIHAGHGGQSSGAGGDSAWEGQDAAKNGAGSSNSAENENSSGSENIPENAQSSSGSGCRAGEGTGQQPGHHHHGQ